ncbi:MAG TPA: hypothetical protein VIE15_07185, partial [Acidimicrobiales bacterium]
ASSPARPLGSTGLRVLAVAPSIRFGARLVYRALITPGSSGGTVLFAQDGVVLPGCAHAKVLAGKASCALIPTSAQRHVILATFTGSRVLSGAEGSLAVLIARAPTSFHVFTTPTAVLPRAALTLWAWHLPGHATGKVVFDSGLVRLCVAGVRDGGASCATAVRLAPGPHVVTARYVGDKDYLGSLATTSFRVLVAQPPPTSAPR